MKKLLICVLALMCLALPALADEEPPLSPDLYLTGNGTTGYQWLYTVEDEAVLTVVDNGFTQEPGTEGMTGAGGVFAFRLDGLKEGATKVTFTYARSWEIDESTLCTVSYNVLVDDDLDVTIFDCSVNPGL